METKKTNEGVKKTKEEVKEERRRKQNEKRKRAQMARKERINAMKKSTFVSIGNCEFYYDNGHCLYCPESISNQSLLKFNQINVEDYESLYQLGFLPHDGTNLLYQDFSTSCCILWNVRVDVKNFKMNRKQRYVLSKWEDFIAGKRGFLIEKKEQKRAKISKKQHIDDLERDLILNENGIKKNMQKFLEKIFGEKYEDQIKFDELKNLYKFKTESKNINENTPIFSELINRFYWKKKLSSDEYSDLNQNDFVKANIRELLNVISTKDLLKKWRISIEGSKLKFVKLQGEEEDELETPLAQETTEEYGYNLFEKKQRRFEIIKSKPIYTTKSTIFSIFIIK